MIPSSARKKELYRQSLEQVNEIIKGETDSIAVMASVACILKANLPHALWVGFYRVDVRKADELVIGPYQGTLGCLRIPFGKGVCGHCAELRQPVIVPDVEKFPDHIACDGRSRSEIVLPVFEAQHRLCAVLDLDSAELNAWSDEDRAGLATILKEIQDIL